MTILREPQMLKMQCLCGFEPFLLRQCISIPPRHFSQCPATSMHKSTPANHIQQQIQDAAQLKMSRNRTQFPQLKRAHAHLLFDGFEPDSDPPTTFVPQNRPWGLHLIVIAHQEDSPIRIMFFIASPFKRRLKRPCRSLGARPSAGRSDITTPEDRSASSPASSLRHESEPPFSSAHTPKRSDSTKPGSRALTVHN